MYPAHPPEPSVWDEGARGMKFQRHNSSIIAIAASVGLLTLAIPGVSSAAAQKSVYLGAAGNYSILAKTGISTTGSTHVNGNMGVSPIASTAITGFNMMQTAPTYSK